MSNVSVRVSPRLLVRDILVSGVLLSARAAVAPSCAGELVSGQRIGMAGGVIGKKFAGKGNKPPGATAVVARGGVLGGVVGGALSR